MFLGLPDPDPLVRGMIPDPDPSIIFLSSSKNSKKNLDSYCFVTPFGLFVFENEVNVPSKSNKQKFFFKLVFCWRLEGQWRKQHDPYPLVRGIDPRIRIHTKMSWIRNTGRQVG
jgi:hypothetical protein